MCNERGALRVREPTWSVFLPYRQPGSLCICVEHLHSTYLFGLNNNGGGQILNMCPYLVMPGRQSKCYAGAASKTHWADWATHSSGKSRHSWPRRPPGKPWSPPSPALGGPGRPQTVGPLAPLHWVPFFAKLFFIPNALFLPCFTWLPTQKRVHATAWRRSPSCVEPFSLCSSASESTSGFPFCFTTLDSVGT